MKKLLFLPILGILIVSFSTAEPSVDGKVQKGEYPNSQALVGGTAKLSWAGDGTGGLYLALEAKGKGWAGLGLGTKSMNGAYIYIGFVTKEGKAVFTEQVSKGHHHSISGNTTADKKALSLSSGTTTMEFHIPGDKLPFKGKTVPFIVAYSDAEDLTTFHEDSLDSGSFTML